jgi:hypothetical protein
MTRRTRPKRGRVARLALLALILAVPVLAGGRAPTVPAAGVSVGPGVAGVNDGWLSWGRRWS